MRGCGALPCNGKDVAKAVFVEAGHCAEVRGQGLALARLKLLNEKIHGLLDDKLCGVVLLAGALLVGGGAALGALRRIFPVRRGGAADGC